MKYLYGAAVQGIQQFIFQTNELKDIVGASELVENICTEKFKETFTDVGLSIVDDNTIINAAGNIKYEFDSKEDCEKIVRVFPKKVLETAPGITISQAVVLLDENESTENYADAINELESRLRIQRNKPMNSTTIGLMGIMRSHRTNMPVVQVLTKKERDTKKEEVDYLDAAILCKRQAVKMLTLCHTAFGDETIGYRDVALDPEEMTLKNDWIAVIHADGNGLGQIVQKVGTKRNTFKDFSQRLDKATKQAAVEAYKEIWRVNEHADEKIPIRPIVLGGDDFTVICRADLALPYVTAFINHFEVQTHKELGMILKENEVFTEGDIQDRLTACAGIAYVKSSYPFYYAYELAEALCTRAKKDAKNKDSIREGKEIAPSCLMFHKVQDSFVENFDEIARRELELSNSRTFEFGPYYINYDKNHRWSVDKLIAEAKLIDEKGKDGNAVKSHLRNWMQLLKEGNTGMAEQKLKRMKNIVTDKDLRKLISEVTKGDRIPAYDILAIHTINTQVTKEEKK